MPSALGWLISWSTGQIWTVFEGSGASGNGLASAHLEVSQEDERRAAAALAVILVNVLV